SSSVASNKPGSSHPGSSPKSAPGKKTGRSSARSPTTSGGASTTGNQASPPSVTILKRGQAPPPAAPSSSQGSSKITAKSLTSSSNTTGADRSTKTGGGRSGKGSGGPGVRKSGVSSSSSSNPTPISTEGPPNEGSQPPNATHRRKKQQGGGVVLTNASVKVQGNVSGRRRGGKSSPSATATSKSSKSTLSGKASTSHSSNQSKILPSSVAVGGGGSGGGSESEETSEVEQPMTPKSHPTPFSSSSTVVPRGQGKANSPTSTGPSGHSPSGRAPPPPPPSSNFPSHSYPHVHFPPSPDAAIGVTSSSAILDTMSSMDANKHIITLDPVSGIPSNHLGHGQYPYLPAEGYAPGFQGYGGHPHGSVTSLPPPPPPPNHGYPPHPAMIGQPSMMMHPSRHPHHPAAPPPPHQTQGGPYPMAAPGVGKQTAQRTTMATTTTVPSAHGRPSGSTGGVAEPAYAGPDFHNSPAPSSLPIPVFTPGAEVTHGQGSTVTSTIGTTNTGRISPVMRGLDTTQTILSDSHPPRQERTSPRTNLHKASSSFSLGGGMANPGFPPTSSASVLGGTIPRSANSSPYISPSLQGMAEDPRLTMLMGGNGIGGGLPPSSMTLPGMMMSGSVGALGGGHSAPALPPSSSVMATIPAEEINASEQHLLRMLRAVDTAASSPGFTSGGPSPPVARGLSASMTAPSPSSSTTQGSGASSNPEEWTASLRSILRIGGGLDG
ncbi:hypothetical protein BJ684DRAFT_19064, partial [Piptocephalis cylindrospora]